MKEYFSNVPDAIQNTVKIAEKCNVEFEFGVTKFPNYDVPEEFKTHAEYFRKLCYDGIKKRYGEIKSGEDYNNTAILVYNYSTGTIMIFHDIETKERYRIINRFIIKVTKQPELLPKLNEEK